MEGFRIFEKILKDDHVKVIDQFKNVLSYNHQHYGFAFQPKYHDAYFFMKDENTTDLKYQRHCKVVTSNDSRKFRLYDYTVEKYFDSFEDWAKDCGCMKPSLSDIKYGRNNKYRMSFDLETLIKTCNLYEKACLNLVRKVCNKSPRLQNSLYDMLYVFADTD